MNRHSLDSTQALPASTTPIDFVSPRTRFASSQQSKACMMGGNVDSRVLQHEPSKVHIRCDEEAWKQFKEQMRGKGVVTNFALAELVRRQKMKNVQERRRLEETRRRREKAQLHSADSSRSLGSVTSPKDSNSKGSLWEGILSQPIFSTVFSMETSLVQQEQSDLNSSHLGSTWKKEKQRRRESVSAPADVFKGNLRPYGEFAVASLNRIHSHQASSRPPGEQQQPIDGEQFDRYQTGNSSRHGERKEGVSAGVGGRRSVNDTTSSPIAREEQEGWIDRISPPSMPADTFRATTKRRASTKSLPQLSMIGSCRNGSYGKLERR